MSIRYGKYGYGKDNLNLYSPNFLYCSDILFNFSEISDLLGGEAF